MLSPITIPGLFITGTDTGVGKTLVAGAIANWFRIKGARVGVCKPIATGCIKRREGLVSEDAEFLAHHANAAFPLDVICPQRFAEALAPAVAAERAKEEINWDAIDTAIKTIAAGCDVIIVEGVGGLMVPVDGKTLIVDIAAWLQLPAIVVARPGLGSINHTLLSVAALRAAQIPVSGVVINRYPPETPPIVEETNPRAIEKWGKTSVLCLVPEFTKHPPHHLPADVVAAIDTVDWVSRANDE